MPRWAAAGTAAACIQVANHEVGTLQPYAEAAEICQRTEVPLVLDATAALGRIDLSDAARLVGADGLGWRVWRSSVGRHSGDQEECPLASALPHRRLPGRPLAGRA